MQTNKYLTKRLRSIIATRNLLGWAAIVDSIPHKAQERYLVSVNSWPSENSGIAFQLVPGSIVALSAKAWGCQIQRVNRAKGYFWSCREGCRTSYFSISDARHQGIAIASQLPIHNTRQLLEQLQALSKFKMLALDDSGQHRSLAEYLGIAGHLERLDDMQLHVLKCEENGLAVEIVGFELPIHLEFFIKQGELKVSAIAGEPTLDYFVKRARIWSSGALSHVGS